MLPEWFVARRWRSKSIDSPRGDVAIFQKYLSSCDLIFDHLSCDMEPRLRLSFIDFSYVTSWLGIPMQFRIFAGIIEVKIRFPYNVYYNKYYVLDILHIFLYIMFRINANFFGTQWCEKHFDFLMLDSRHFEFFKLKQKPSSSHNTHALHIIHFLKSCT